MYKTINMSNMKVTYKREWWKGLAEKYQGFVDIRKAAISNNDTILLYIHRFRRYVLLLYK